MTQPINLELLVDAMVWSLYQVKITDTDLKRPTRKPIDGDLLTIAELISEINLAFSHEFTIAHNHNLPKPNYAEFKSHYLSDEKRACRWNQTTRNLYSSIISIYTGFKRAKNGIDEKKKKIIAEMKPGVLLYINPWIHTRTQPYQYQLI
ncbi:MAG: hypothetical protein ACI92I_000968 [Acidimicrobiales bacterium]|jgi:hypothetical protein